MAREYYKKIHPAQKKVLLGFLMNMDFKDVPQKVGVIDEMLDTCYQQNRESFRNYFNAVVKGDFEFSNGDEKEVLTEREQGFRAALEYFKEASQPAIEGFDKKMELIHEGFRDQVAETYINLDSRATNIAEKAIAEAAKRYEQVEHVVKVGSSAKKKMKGVLPPEFDRVLSLAANRVNTMMVGPAGCGKTFMAGKIAEALGLDYSAQSCSAGMSESQLTGWLIPTGDNGRFEYVQSEFIRIYEGGGVFLFDEMDAADPNVLIIINSALANGEIFIPQRHENPVVKKHKDFVAIAAANTYGGGADAVYSARNALDGATLDRFRIGMVGVDYNEEVERKLAGDVVYEWGANIRNKIREKKMRKIMSTRVMQDAKKMMDAGWSLEQLNESFFADWSEQERMVAGL